jgi:putative transposase
VTKKYKAQEIISKLRNVERQAASGRRISDCVREIGVTEVTYYRWRAKYMAIESDWPEHLTELETEVSRLRRLVSDLTLDKIILMQATTGMLTPELRATYVLQVGAMLGISERRACQALGQHRSTQRKVRARLSLELSTGSKRHLLNTP